MAIRELQGAILKEVSYFSTDFYNRVKICEEIGIKKVHLIVCFTINRVFLPHMIPSEERMEYLYSAGVSALNVNNFNLTNKI